MGLNSFDKKILKKIGGRVQRARASASFTSQDGVVSEIENELKRHLSKTGLSNIEQGNSNCRILTLAWIALACKVPLEYFTLGVLREESAMTRDEELHGLVSTMLQAGGEARDHIIQVVGRAYTRYLKSGLGQPEEKKSGQSA